MKLKKRGEKSYSLWWTLKKSVEAPASIIGVTLLVVYGLKNRGVDVSEEWAVSICTIFYGLYRGVRNHIKNRDK